MTNEQKLWNDLMGVLQRNADAINKIIASERIACVVLADVVGGTPLHLGWDGEAEMFRLSKAQVKRFADNSESLGDYKTAGWLRRSGSGYGRIFVFMGSGTLLLSWTETNGFFVEPGSLDCHRASA